MPKEMLSLATNKRQIVLFYHSDRKNHREIRAYLESAKADLRAIDVANIKVSHSTWTDVADFLNCTIKEIVPHQHADYKDHYGDTILSDNETLSALDKNPIILAHAIAVKGNQAEFVKDYGEALKFHEPDTAGIEKTPLGHENKY